MPNHLVGVLLRPEHKHVFGENYFARSRAEMDVLCECFQRHVIPKTMPSAYDVK